MAKAIESDLTAAEHTLKELLVGSLVLAAGIRAGFPFLQFANDVAGLESLLQIDSPITLSPAPEIPADLTPDQKDHLALMQLDSQEVTQLHCDANGTLTLKFHGGRSLIVSGTACDDSNPEPWVVTQTNVKTTEGGAKVVSLGYSGFAVWKRTPDLPDAH